MSELLVTRVTSHRGYNFEPPLPVPGYDMFDTNESIGRVVCKSRFIQYDPDTSIAKIPDPLTEEIIGRYADTIDGLASSPLEQLQNVQLFIPHGTIVTRSY